MVGLPADVDYCLQSMIELHEMTADVYDFFYYEKTNPADFFDRNNGRTEILIGEYQRWREHEATLPKRAHLTLNGLRSQLLYQRIDLCKAITNDSIAAKGGKPLKKEIENFVYEGYGQKRYWENFQTLCDQFAADFKDSSSSFLNDVRNSMLGHRSMDEDRYNVLQEIRNTFNPVPKQLERRQEKQRRKRIVRSINLLEQFLGKHETKIFLGERYVHINGTEFNFKVEAKSQLSAMGHGGINVTVMDKSDNDLSKLCVYYENMPVADQIVAFMLDIKTGNERDIINTGNLFGITEDGYQNKILCEIKGLVTKNLSDLNTILYEPGRTRPLFGDEESQNMIKYHDSIMPIVSRMVNKILRKDVRHILSKAGGMFNGDSVILQIAS